VGLAGGTVRNREGLEAVQALLSNP